MTTAQLLAIGLAGIACVCDLRTRRIPQVVTLGGAAAGLLFHFITGGWSGGMASVAGWFAGMLIFFIPFALGGLGAGDVKLLGALGAWLGPTDAVWLALYSGVAGLVLALGLSLATGYLRQALVNITLLLTHWRTNGLRPLADLTLEHGKGPRFAYAVPILAGTMVTLWLR